MKTLDDTWALEADELNLTVKRGRPSWCEPPSWDQPLPLPENAKQLRTLMDALWPTK